MVSAFWAAAARGAASLRSVASDANGPDPAAVVPLVVAVPPDADMSRVAAEPPLAGAAADDAVADEFVLDAAPEHPAKQASASAAA